MQVFIDNELIKTIISSKANSQNSILKRLIDAGILADHLSFQLSFGWPSLLECLGLGSLFENLSPFNQSKLFDLLTSHLILNSEKNLLIHLYDQIFVECLTAIKALPEIHSSFLIERIQDKRKAFLSSEAHELFALPLDRYEKLLKEHPSHAMHDLILYLAWDRVCVNLALVFECDILKAESRNGLEILRECLLESFQHITAHGRTAPGFFRLIETLYAYQMREENLQTYTDSDWLMLCQSACVLKPREKLSDVFYIDAAIIHHQELKKFANKNEILTILTLDTPDKVKPGLAYARFMLEKLKLEASEWPYTLRPVQVFCLKPSENSLSLEAII